ncbi:hypothetical protein JCM10450v2_001392 [Rhodotorula kratochvilovae]
MASTSRYAPYDRSHPPTPPARWAKHPRRPLGSVTAPTLNAQPGPLSKDIKGKGKARDQSGAPDRAAESWRDADALLQHSFTAHRIATFINFPLSSKSSSSRLAAFAKSLRAYLTQQLALGLDPDLRLGRKDKLVTRVEAGYVDVRIGGKAGVRPILIEVELGSDDSAASASTVAPASKSGSRTALFLLLPALDSASDAPAFPLLLVKSPLPALTHLFTTYLSTRHDALLHPLRLAPTTMLNLAESLVLHRDTALEADLAAGETPLATNLTFAFPPTIAREGLSSLTLTLPPALLAPLCTLGGEGGFTAGLAAHLQRTTALPLERLALVRVGAGRGTFVHSGQGAGEASAKVKFFREQRSRHQPLFYGDKAPRTPRMRLFALLAHALLSPFASGTALIAAPYRAYPLPLGPLAPPSPSPFAPLQQTFPAALTQNAAGELVFDRRAFGRSEGDKEICFRDVFGGAASFTLDLSTSLSLVDAAGTPFRLSSGEKTTLNFSRAAYVQGCYPASVWALLRGEVGDVQAGSVGGVAGSVVSDRMVQQGSGLREGELEAALAGEGGRDPTGSA